jgi:hypothetical protein
MFSFLLLSYLYLNIVVAFIYIHCSLKKYFCYFPILLLLFYTTDFIFCLFFLSTYVFFYLICCFFCWHFIFFHLAIVDLFIFYYALPEYLYTSFFFLFYNFSSSSFFFFHVLFRNVFLAFLIAREINKTHSIVDGYFLILFHFSLYVSNSLSSSQSHSFLTSLIHCSCYPFKFFFPSICFIFHYSAFFK